MIRRPNHVSIRAGQVEFVKVGTDAWRWRDVYRWLLGLNWPRFAAFVASLYLGLNFLFAALYSFQQNSIAGSTGGHWFFDCFFFSVQTLATVGYGHMYPQTLYGHIVTTIEIMSGIFLFAVMTGLIFVRFLAQLSSRSNPIGSSLLSPSLESIQSLRPPLKRKRIIAGAIFNSAIALSKSTPSTAAAGSRWITAAFTTPNKWNLQFTVTDMTGLPPTSKHSFDD